MYLNLYLYLYFCKLHNLVVIQAYFDIFVVVNFAHKLLSYIVLVGKPYLFSVFIDNLVLDIDYRYKICKVKDCQEYTLLG